VRAVHLPDSVERHDYLFDPGFAPVLARQELNYPIIQYPAAVLDELDLPAADRERILNGNAKRLLHLAQ
jgi:hypothetical protein